MIDSQEKAVLPLSLQEKLASLENLLREQNPGYAGVLDWIHGETRKHPEYVYALSDEQIALIVCGYERYTKITIDVGKVSKKQAALLTADDV